MVAVENWCLTLYLHEDYREQEVQEETNRYSSDYYYEGLSNGVNELGDIRENDI